MSIKKLSPETKRRITFSAIAVILVLIGIIAVCISNFTKYHHYFLPKTYINNVDVGNLDMEKAMKAIEKTKMKELSIVTEDHSWTINLSDINLQYNCEDELKEILATQGKGLFIKSAPKKYRLKSGYSVDREKLKEALQAIDFEGTSPENAHLIIQERKAYIVSENNGTDFNLERLATETETALREAKSEFTPSQSAYEIPKIKEGDLAKLQEDTNTLLKARITIPLSDGDRMLNYSTTRDWVNLNKFKIDREDILEHAKEYVKGLAEEDDFYGKYIPFKSTNYGLQKFESEEEHGHVLDQEQLAENITDALLKGEKTIVKPIYKKYIDNYGIGGTYVEVDIYNQHVYYYKNHQLTYECDCVSGTEQTGKGTPDGVFCVEEKEKGRDLNGFNSNGDLIYSVWVNYWIQFLPHYGLHDASWRDEFGGNIYEYEGSHGCVNLPKDAARYFYEELEIGTPIIVLRGEK